MGWRISFALVIFVDMFYHALIVPAMFSSTSLIMMLWYWSVGCIQLQCGIPSLSSPRLMHFCADVARTWLFLIAANISLNATLCVTIPLTYLWQFLGQPITGWDLPWVNVTKANMTEDERQNFFGDWKWTIHDPRITYTDPRIRTNPVRYNFFFVTRPVIRAYQVMTAMKTIIS